MTITKMPKTCTKEKIILAQTIIDSHIANSSDMETCIKKISNDRMLEYDAVNDHSRIGAHVKWLESIRGHCVDLTNGGLQQPGFDDDIEIVKQLHTQEDAHVHIAEFCAQINRKKTNHD